MSSLTRPAWPIVIVTGANKYVDILHLPVSLELRSPTFRAASGVGFGICRRLLYGFAQDSPDDARPLFPRSGVDEPGIEYPCAGLTLIMACRSRQRAEAARTQLLSLFDSDVERLRKLPGGAERVIAFRANLVIAVHTLDLASVQSTLAFADEVART
jgi:3-keto steroid reductase